MSIVTDSYANLTLGQTASHCQKGWSSKKIGSIAQPFGHVAFIRQIPKHYKKSSFRLKMTTCLEFMYKAQTRPEQTKPRILWCFTTSTDHAPHISRQRGCWKRTNVQDYKHSAKGKFYDSSYKEKIM